MSDLRVKPGIDRVDADEVKARMEQLVVDATPEAAVLLADAIDKGIDRRSAVLLVADLRTPWAFDLAALYGCDRAECERRVAAAEPLFLAVNHEREVDKWGEIVGEPGVAPLRTPPADDAVRTLCVAYDAVMPFLVYLTPMLPIGQA